MVVNVLPWFQRFSLFGEIFLSLTSTTVTRAAFSRERKKEEKRKRTSGTTVWMQNISVIFPPNVVHLNLSLGGRRPHVTCNKRLKLPWGSKILYDHLNYQKVVNTKPTWISYVMWYIASYFPSTVPSIHHRQCQLTVCLIHGLSCKFKTATHVNTNF